MIHHPSQHRARRNDPQRLRVGAVQYLNTRPLVHGLAAAGVDVRYDLPSRLADQLARGHLDVALIPSIEVFRGGHAVVSDACIGCRGPVMSVKLFFRTAPAKVVTLAVDEGSRTSASLARILLAERHGVFPVVENLPIGSGLADTAADAVLLIGDRAIDSTGSTDRAAGCFQVIWDLGDEWCRWTGLPFVFAVWAARAGVDAGPLEPQLTRARDSGVCNLAAIAAAEAGAHGLTVPQCLSYLRDNLHYHLGAGEREALALFQRHAAGLNLAPAEGQSLRGERPAAWSGRIAATGHERSDAR
ncbi:MAG: menaquinone biosynthesis protein [Planctomycetia bacterium]|nr:menaquinone biosynthesis protein [Planctomycetia bacterium]